LVGTIVGYPASLLSGNGPDLGVGVGSVVGGGFFAASQAPISLEVALTKQKENKIWESRLSLARAYLEASTGLAVSLGIPGHALGGDMGLLLGAASGAMFGIAFTNCERKLRAKGFPELITPEGNSTLRNADIPTSVDGRLYPPVYYAKNLSDWIAFREANKEAILKWAGNIPQVSTSPGGYIPDEGPVNSVVVLAEVEHRPINDPENSPGIHIADKNLTKGGAEILTLPVDPFFYWNNGSRFSGAGLGIGGKVLPDNQWVAFKENSWSRSVVVLDQYQSAVQKDSNQTLESIENSYWLLHVYGEGIKNAKRQRAAAKPVMIPEFNPGNI